MGRNLLYNIAELNFSIIGFYRNAHKLEEIKSGVSNLMNIKFIDSLEYLVSSLEIPRKIILMLPAGDTINEVINKIKHLLEPLDIIINGGNSYFVDTNKSIKL